MHVGDMICRYSDSRMPCCLLAAALPLHQALSTPLSSLSASARASDHAGQTRAASPLARIPDSLQRYSQEPTPWRDPIRLFCPGTTLPLSRHHQIPTPSNRLSRPPASRLPRYRPRYSTMLHDAPRFGRPRPKPFFAILAGQTGVLADGSLAWTPSS